MSNGGEMVNPFARTPEQEIQAIDRALDPSMPGGGSSGSIRSDGSPQVLLSTLGRVRLLLRAYGELKRSNADLLEALEGVVERVKYYTDREAEREAAGEEIPDEGWHYTWNSGEMDKARAAIAKAKGEEA